MSYKSALSNSVKSNSDAQQWLKNNSVETNVKFAGEEAKDRLYEPKHKKKLVRVLTVVAYIFSVSLAAIMLSLYYVFLYPKNNKEFIETTTIGMRSNGILSESLRKEQLTLPLYEEITTEISSKKRNVFIQKLMSTLETNYLNDTYK